MNIVNHTILTITQVANQVRYNLEQNFSNLWNLIIVIFLIMVIVILVLAKFKPQHKENYKAWGVVMPIPTWPYWVIRIFSTRFGTLPSASEVKNLISLV